MTQARENLSSGRLDLVESALRTADQYLTGLTDDEAAALRTEIAAIRSELANRPTDEEGRAISAARGKLRSARSRFEERNLDNIDDVLASAANYLSPVRPEHRASVDAEIAALRAEIDAVRKPPAPVTAAPVSSAPVPAPAAARMSGATGTSGAAPAAAPSVSPQTDEEQRCISAARGKLRAARSRIADDQLLGIDDVIAAAVNYLAPVRPEHRVAIDEEIAIVRGEIEAARQPASTSAAGASGSVTASGSAASSGPTDEEQRHITAARNKLRAARSRIADDQTIGIEDVVDAAENYLSVVRPEHRAAVDEEIKIVRGEIKVALQPKTPPPHLVLHSNQVGAGAPPPPAPGYPPPPAGLPPSAYPPPPAPGASSYPPPSASAYPPPPAPGASSYPPPSASAYPPPPVSPSPPPPSPPPQSPPPAPWNPPPPVVGAAPPPPAPPPPAPPSPPPVATGVTPAASATPSAEDAPTEDEERALGAARSMIRLAQRKLGDEQLPGIDEVFLAAVDHLKKVRPAHRTPVEVQLNALRASIIASPGGADALGPSVLMLRLASARAATAPLQAPAEAVPRRAVTAPIEDAEPAPAPAPVAASAVPAPVAPAVAAPSVPERPLTDEDRSNLSRARGKISSARSAVESRRLDAVQPALDEALSMIAGVPASGSASHRAEIDAIRKLLADEVRAQAKKKVADDVERHLRSAESDAEYHQVGTGEEAVQRALQRLEQPDVAEALTTEQIAGYRERAATLRAGFAATLLGDAVARARPAMDELERLAPVDVFARMDGHELVRKEREIDHTRLRVIGAIRNLPADHPDIVRLLHRLAAVERRIGASAARWSRPRREQVVVNDWGAIAHETDGWTQEPPASDVEVQQLAEPELIKTRFALQRTRLFLASSHVRAMSSAARPMTGEDSTAIQDPRELAKQMSAAAATKLAAAYIRLLDRAEQIEPPLDLFLLRRPAQIAYNADAALAGSPHRDAIVARAEAVDDRWRSAFVVATKGQYELYDKLAREAEQKWPALRDSTNALPFDLDRVKPGALLFFEQVANRAGWDYVGRGDLDFAARFGSALIGGTCAPEVRKALQHAWGVQKLDLNERVLWNVIGVVRSSTMVGVRTLVKVREHESGDYLGEIETFSPQPCVMVEVVGLQAGPVVVFDQAATAR